MFKKLWRVHLRTKSAKRHKKRFRMIKHPGKTDLPSNFIVYFFKLLGNDLIASFNKAHEKGELPISQRRGIITLTPISVRHLIRLNGPINIMRTLDYFKFGSDIKRWVKIFYTNIESAVQNNGFITNWFKPSKGVRQGCPLSPYLFILSPEVLSIKIRQDSNVRGIKIFGREIKLSQFADDTTLFNADLESLELALKIVGDFGKIAGLPLNVKKTMALWLGRWKTNRNKPVDCSFIFA